MRYHLLPILALLPLILTACGEPPDTHPGQPLTHRRAAFEGILRTFEPMGIQLRKNQYKPDQFIAQARELARVKDAPWQYFGPDTNYPPTRANDKVWNEPEKFDTARKTFLQATDRLLQAAESRDEKRVTAAYEELQESCRSCHKAFRN